MDIAKEFILKYKYYFILSGIIICLLIGFVFKTPEVVIKEIEKEVVKQESITNYKVDIKGEIKNPGVYELSSSSRVIDVINLSGGLKENANTEYINLSKKIEDEMVIVIYSNDDISRFKEGNEKTIYKDYECNCPDNINDICIDNSDILDYTNSIDIDEKDFKISINTASKEELMTLTGIGEGKADAIIKYREEFGKFLNIEDIKNVSGIGDSVYTKIKDYIKL